MRSRRNSLSIEFVGALNLVAVEFFTDEQVLNAWRALLSEFEQAAQTKVDDARLTQKREYLRAVLLSQIAKSLSFRIPALEIFRGDYNPQGHVDAEEEIEFNRRFLFDIAIGAKAFPVIIVPPLPVSGGPSPDSSSPPNRAGG